MVAAGGTLATVVAAGLVQRTEQRHAEQLLDRHADDVGEAVNSEAVRYHDTLADMAASVGAQSDFTLDDFFGITSRLDRRRFSGATGITFVVSATDVQLPAVQARWRSQGAGGLRLVPTGSAAEHVFMVFSRSLDATSPGAGRDLSLVPEATEALNFARHTRRVSASRTFVLLKDRNLPAERQQRAFLIAAPVFGGEGTREAGQFRGWMVMGMRGADFLTEALQARLANSVDVAFADLSGAAPVVIAGAADLHPDHPHRLRTVVVGQRTWQLQIAANGTLLSEADRRMPALTLTAGLLTTAMLTVLVGALASARNRALAKVDQATAALRRDIERRKEIEAELQRLALHDSLTGLPNRTLLYERVDHAIAAHRRTANTLAVLYVDLDGFKEINDTYGHQAGDRVLVEVANRLRDCLRTSDTVARLGGDEFAILAEQITDPAHARTVAAHVVQALQPPFDVDGRQARLTASVGLTTHCPRTAVAGVQEILFRADQAMYDAKAAGKDRFVIAPEPVAGPEAVADPASVS